MNRDEYRALTRTAEGRALRDFLRAAADPHANTSRRELEADLDEAGITDEKQRAALVATYTDIAKEARAGDNAMELGGAADILALNHLREHRAADDLMGEHGIPETAPDRDAAEEMAEHARAKSRGLSDDEYAREKADRTERDRLERLGFRPG